MRNRVIFAVLVAASVTLNGPRVGQASTSAPLAKPEADSAITVTLLDPVPTLLSGSQVTTNYNTLATQGRAVQGVEADGVTELVVRRPASAAGLQFTVMLLNDQGVRSTSPNNDGALAQIGGTGFTQSQLTVTSVNTSAGPMGFFLYRAPVDCPRPSGQDANSSSRIVTLQVVQSSTTSDTTVTILRPPVVLVHGLWGSLPIGTLSRPLSTTRFLRNFVLTIRSRSARTSRRIRRHIPLGTRERSSRLLRPPPWVSPTMRPRC